MKKIFVNNLTVIGAGRVPFCVVGSPAENRVESVVLNNVRLTYEGGIKQTDGYSVDASSGFYFQNVEHVELNNVRVDYQEKDARPVLIAENVGKLILDHVIVPQVPESFPLYVVEKVGELRVDGKPAAASAGQTRGLEVDVSRTGGKAVVGEPFNAIATVEKNTGGEGLVEVRLRFGQENFSKSIWLKGKETRQVLFADLKCSTPGEYRIEAGKFQRTVTAEAVPVAQPIGAPYLTFTNVKSDLARRGDTFSLAALDGEYFLNAIGGGDRYASVYLKDSLGQNAAITVRIDKPNPPVASRGKAGIMVRNDIFRPEQSAGYVVVESSIQYGADTRWSNGFSMEWDADGNGRIDRHTPFAGYTLWPHWLKLERRGGKYTGYYSLDREVWNKIAEVEAPGGERGSGCGDVCDVGWWAVKDMKISELTKP